MQLCLESHLATSCAAQLLRSSPFLSTCDYALPRCVIRSAAEHRSRVVDRSGPMTAPSPGRFDARLRSAGRQASDFGSRPWSDPRIFSRPRQRRRTLICVRITAEEVKRNIVFITSEVAPSPVHLSTAAVPAPLRSHRIGSDRTPVSHRDHQTARVTTAAHTKQPWALAVRCQWCSTSIRQAACRGTGYGMSMSDVNAN